MANIYAHMHNNADSQAEPNSAVNMGGDCLITDEGFLDPINCSKPEMNSSHASSLSVHNVMFEFDTSIEMHQKSEEGHNQGHDNFSHLLSREKNLSDGEVSAKAET